MTTVLGPVKATSKKIKNTVYVGYLTKIYFVLKKRNVDNLQQQQPQQVKG